MDHAEARRTVQGSVGGAVATVARRPRAIGTTTKGPLDVPVEFRTDPPSLSVLIVTYRSAGFVEGCLDSLIGQEPGRSVEIIVFDNCSDDGTPDIVRSRFPSVQVVPCRENLGFARANNRAMALSRGTRLLVLNPDTVVPPGTLDLLMATLDADPGIGIVGPRLVNPDGSDQQTARAFPTPAAALLGRRSPLTRLWPHNPWSRRYLDTRHAAATSPFDVDWLSGACMLLRREVALATGGFDERYFMYWEDADWCRRMAGAGFRVVCDPRAVVVHDEGAGRGRSARQVLAFHRSAYLYFSRHHLQGAWRLLRPAARTALTLRGALTLVVGHRPWRGRGSGRDRS